MQHRGDSQPRDHRMQNQTRTEKAASLQKHLFCFVFRYYALQKHAEALHVGVKSERKGANKPSGRLGARARFALFLAGGCSETRLARRLSQRRASYSRCKGRGHPAK